MKTFVFHVCKTVEVTLLTDAVPDNGELRLAAEVAARHGHAESELMAARVAGTDIKEADVLTGGENHG